MDLSRALIEENRRLSLADIYKLLPWQESEFADEAERLTEEFAIRWNIRPPSFDDYNTMSRFLYPNSLGVEHLAAVCTVHSIFFFIDDLFFDTDALLPEDYSIAPAIAADPRKVIAFLRDLMNIFRARELPANPTLIQQAFCEIGQQVAALSSEAWFQYFTDTVEDYIRAAISRSADIRTDKLSVKDMGAFSEIRERDTGGLHTCVLIELSKEAFLPDVVRDDPIVQRLTMLCIRMASFVNDICSYHKDVIVEGSEFNMVKMFMDNDGLSFEDAVHKSVEVVNEYAQAYLDTESLLPSWGPEVDPIARAYVAGLKELMAGNVYWHLTTNRYRSPDSPFEELQNLH